MAVIRFYAPAHYWPEGALPGRVDELPEAYVEQLNGVKTWAVMTYIHLKAAGLAVERTEEVPAAGIVLSHRSMIVRVPFNPELFLVSLQSDKEPHKWAPFSIVQNELQARRRAPYVPHWPQPRLVPRDPERDVFERVVFPGRRVNLLAEFLSDAFAAQLAEEGLRFEAIEPNCRDYSQVDCVLAVRGFTYDERVCGFKPPSKVINAWHAGVPVIVGPESAYRQLAPPGEAYLEAESVEEVRAHLRRLRDDPDERARLVARGRELARDYTPEAIAERWRRIIEDQIIPAYERWRRRPAWRKWAYWQWCKLKWPLGHRERQRYKRVPNPDAKRK